MAASLTTQSCDLTSCNKCHQLLKNPKSLPCLHSYCTSCLEKEVDQSKNTVKCSVCAEECVLPAGGVNGLEPLAIIQRLTEQKAMQTRLMTKETISCTACLGIKTDDTSNTKSDPPVAVARCSECDDYLCTRCVAIHRSQRTMRDHPVFTLEELRSGKGPDIDAFEQKICPKHKGEALLFYCDTCDVPICRQCVVIAHRHPDHKQVELDQAAKERSDTLRQLQDVCGQNEDKVIKALEEIRKVKRDLEQNVVEARIQIKETVQELKSSYLDRLEEAQKLANEELNAIQMEKQNGIKTTEDQLMSISSRISTAKALTKKVLESGTEYEIASVFSNLKNSLQKLANARSSEVNKSFSELKFEPNQANQEQINVGRVHCHSRRVRDFTNPATLQKEFGNIGNDKLRLALDVAITQVGDIAVTDYSTTKVKVFNQEGMMKFAFNVNVGVDVGKASNPWCIQVGPDDILYITDFRSPYVKTFDMQGAYKHYFHTVSPDNVPYSTYGSSQLCGLCFNSKDQVLVGNITHHFISCHSSDGTHISSIKVNIRPSFLAVTSADHIVISPYTPGSDVQIIDGLGNILHKLQKPEGVPSWYPTGVVIASKLYHVYSTDDSEDEIFVADRDNGHAVYRYSSSGKYINVVTKEVSNIYGVALSTKEDKLFVACSNLVKSFII